MHSGWFSRALTRFMLPHGKLMVHNLCFLRLSIASLKFMLFEPGTQVRYKTELTMHNGYLQSSSLNQYSPACKENVND